MKKALFIFFAVISLLNYAAAAFLLYIHYTQKDVGMPLLFFMPLLIIGILSGLLSLATKNILKLILTGILVKLHKLNIVLLIIGNLAFLYYYFSQ